MKVLMIIVLWIMQVIGGVAHAGMVVSIRNHNDVNGCERYIIDYKSDADTIVGMMQDMRNDMVIQAYVKTGQVIQVNLYGLPDKDGYTTLISTLNMTDPHSDCTALDGPYSGYGWVLDK